MSDTAASNVTGSDTLNPLDIDTRVQQTVSNLACFVLGFSFCVIAFIAQIANIILVFRQTVRKSRKIFFYILLSSAVLCSSVSVMCGARVLILYLSNHSQAWIEMLNTIDLALYPELANTVNVYNYFSRSINIAYSLFTLLYILCVQMRFQSIRAIFEYPKWVDYALFLLTSLLWISTEFLWTLVLYDPKTKMSMKMSTVWSFYVLLADNVFSGIFLWRLAKALREVRNFSQRRGKISRSIGRSMVGMCATMWATLIIFTINPIVFSSEKNKNLFSVVFCLSFAMLPILFAFGILWMQAVLQLYSVQPDTSAVRSAPPHPQNANSQGSRGVHNPSPSMDSNVSPSSKPTSKDGWKALDAEEHGLDTGSVVEMTYVAYPASTAGRGH